MARVVTGVTVFALVGTNAHNLQTSNTKAVFVHDHPKQHNLLFSPRNSSHESNPCNSTDSVTLTSNHDEKTTQTSPTEGTTTTTTEDTTPSGGYHNPNLYELLPRHGGFAAVRSTRSARKRRNNKSVEEKPKIPSTFVLKPPTQAIPSWSEASSTRDGANNLSAESSNANEKSGNGIKNEGGEYLVFGTNGSSSVASADVQVLQQPQKAEAVAKNFVNQISSLPLLAKMALIVPSLAMGFAWSVGIKAMTASIMTPVFKELGMTPQAAFYMLLLALQFGFQPTLTRRFVPQKMCRSSVVMTQEALKFVISGLFISMGTGWSSALSGWSLRSWAFVACVPAGLYTIQNLSSLIAYQNLPAVTFNVLNQTKTLSAALCCYLIMGKRQTQLQIVSLFVLLTAALVIERVIKLPNFNSGGDDGSGIGEASVENDESFDSEEERDVEEEKLPSLTSTRHFTHGVIPVLIASFISGLAGALTQKSLQVNFRNPYLFTMELAVASSILMLVTLPIREDGKKMWNEGFFANWTPKALIPITTNALGGIVVGLVTKHAGAVKKGFALIFGLLISGIIQATMDKYDAGTTFAITKEQIAGGVLAGISLWMHSSFR